MSLQRQLKLVSPAVFLDEAAPWKSLVLIIVAIVSTFTLLLIWSAFATIHESAVVFGQVEPESKIDIIEHPLGGIVETIQVENGQHVRKGDVLLTLKTSRAHAQLKQLLAREVHLRLDKIRLKALLNKEPPHAINWQPAFEKQQHLSPSEEERLQQEEMATFKQQHTDHIQQLATLALQVKKYQTEVQRYEAQKQSAANNLALHQKELDMYDQLATKNYVSKRDHLIAQRKINSAKSELATAINHLAYANSEVKEYDAKYKAQQSTFQNEMQQSLDKINAKLAEITHQLTPLQDEVKRHTITAPTDGKVTGLNLKANNVIGPDEKMLEIVPDTRHFVVNARLNTKDVGHVKVGDAANIQILTYDYARYGDIAGVVTHISANTQYTEENKPYFEISIRPQKTYVGKNAKHQITTGMTAQANIITGEKTILSYMLSPIHKSIDSAMHER